MALPGSLTSFGLKPLILIHFEAAGQWEWFPGLGFRRGCPRLLGPVPVPVRRPEVACPLSLGSQQQERQQQHGPGEWEEPGGGTVADAVQYLGLGVVCRADEKAKAPR